LYVVPDVSVVRVVVPQPDLRILEDSGSVTVHAMVTSLVYQPSLPSVPVTVGVITGGVLSLASPIDDTPARRPASRIDASDGRFMFSLCAHGRLRGRRIERRSPWIRCRAALPMRPTRSECGRAYKGKLKET